MGRSAQCIVQSAFFCTEDEGGRCPVEGLRCFSFGLWLLGSRRNLPPCFPFLSPLFRSPPQIDRDLQVVRDVKGPNREGNDNPFLRIAPVEPFYKFVSDKIALREFFHCQDVLKVNGRLAKIRNSGSSVRGPSWPLPLRPGPRHGGSRLPAGVLAYMLKNPAATLARTTVRENRKRIRGMWPKNCAGSDFSGVEVRAPLRLARNTHRKTIPRREFMRMETESKWIFLAALRRSLKPGFSARRPSTTPPARNAAGVGQSPMVMSKGMESPEKATLHPGVV